VRADPGPGPQEPDADAEEAAEQDAAGPDPSPAIAGAWDDVLAERQAEHLAHRQPARRT
jgi:hypothetical protein